jgi:hypothetical protein
VIESCNRRKRCAAIACLAEALSAAGMDQIAKVFGEPGFRRRVRFDDFEVGGHFDVVMQDPVRRMVTVFEIFLFATRAETAAGKVAWRRFCRSQSKRASIVEPARTVAAFHSPFARAMLMAPMSFRRFVRRSASVMKLSSDVPGAGDSSAHFAKASRMWRSGLLERWRLKSRSLWPAFWFDVQVPSISLIVPLARMSDPARADAVHPHEFGALPGGDVVDERNDLAGDDSGHGIPQENSSTRAVSAWLAGGTGDGESPWRGRGSDIRQNPRAQRADKLFLCSGRLRHFQSARYKNFSK